MHPCPNKNLAHVDLLLGPTGAGKTRAAIGRFCERPSESLLVVTTKAQAEWMAQRAEQAHGLVAAEARIRILPWSNFVAEALRADRGETGGFISRAFQRVILSTLVPATIGPGDFLGKMLVAPGFVSALQERIREWKLAGAPPAAFDAAARLAASRGAPNLARKLEEIERLFNAYERFLGDNGLHDEEDRLVRAAELMDLQENPVPLDARRIVVHGFYRFTTAQRRLLRALAERGVATGRPELELTITLPWDERRPLLFAAPGRTLSHLRSEFETREVVLPAARTEEAAKAGMLVHMSQALFAGDRLLIPRANVSDDASSIRIFEAPNPYVETEMVAREFRRLHERLGIPWHRFAVILRSAADYAPILSSVFERYGVPIAAEGAENCSRNPLLQTVLKLFDVVRFGWRRDDVLTFLRSSYTAPDCLDVDRLRKSAMAGAVREGREQWLALAVPARMATDAEANGWMSSLAAVLQEMSRIDDMLRREPAGAAYFAGAVREILLRFGMEGRIALGDPVRVERDRSALKEGQATLDALVRMAEMRATGAISLAAFHALLADAWEHTIAYPGASGDQVRVLEPHASRECPMQVCAVMGLTERVFPRRVTEDAFLRDEERRLLREWTGVDLEEQRLRADDERFLFYLAATAPTERLLLTFPRAAHENDTLPSFFLDEVRAVFEGGSAVATTGCDPESCGDGPASGVEVVVRTLADVAPRSSETVTPADVLLSACADLFDPQGEDAPRRERALDGAARIERLLRAKDSAAQARGALRSRNLPRFPALRDDRLRERFISAKPVYTVVELETYARCPFRYLLRHVWNLKAEVESLDGARQSALMHSVLRRYFRNRLKKSEPHTALEPANVFTELQKILWASLQEARLNASPHQIQILRRRLDDDLMGFAVREARYAERFGAEPAHFHLSFGRAPVAVAPDPLSCSEPLIIAGANGEGMVAISGFIDRVDLDGTGEKGIVVEYEIGRPPEFAAIQRGESLQMPINLLALERLFGIAAACACYDSMQETGRRRFHRTEHVNVRQFAPVMPFDDAANVKPLSREQYADLVATAQASALRLADSIACGRVDATPGTHCRACEYRDVCRTSAIDGHDGERLPGQ